MLESFPSRPPATREGIRLTRFLVGQTLKCPPIGRFYKFSLRALFQSRHVDAVRPNTCEPIHGRNRDGAGGVLFTHFRRDSLVCVRFCSLSLTLRGSGSRPVCLGHFGTGNRNMVLGAVRTHESCQTRAGAAFYSL